MGVRLAHLGPVALLVLLALPAVAQAPSSPVRCTMRNVPPFAFEESGARTGFTVDLWGAIAERIGVETVWSNAGTVTELLDAVREGSADVGVGAVSITAERQRSLEFSQPFFSAGLQVLVRASGGAAPQSGAEMLIRNLFSREVLKLGGIAVAMALAAAHLVWLLERRRPDAGLAEAAGYRRGILKSLWWSAATLAAQADEMPRSYLGRVLAVMWMVASIVLVAGFTAQLTTSLTVARLEGPIQGPSDLPGKRVATTKGSTAERYLTDHGAQVIAVEALPEAYDALLAARADAVVFDAPMLLHYAAREGQGRVAVVGPVFQKESYGLALPVNSPLRRPVDEALLTIREDGTYDLLYEKWFGRDDAK